MDRQEKIFVLGFFIVVFVGAVFLFLVKPTKAIETIGTADITVCDENGWCGEVEEPTAPSGGGGGGGIELKSCDRLGGYICDENQTCPGKWLKSRDKRCCSEECVLVFYDLVLEEVKIRSAGANFLVNLKIENRGNRDVTGFFIGIERKDSGKRIFSFFVPGLKADEKIEISKKIRKSVFELIGEKNIFLFIVDFTKMIGEINEENNVFEINMEETLKELKVTAPLGREIAFFVSLKGSSLKFLDSQEILVLDNKKQPIKGFLMEISEPDGSTRKLVTDEFGRITFKLNKIGGYSLSMVGYGEEKTINFHSYANITDLLLLLNVFLFSVIILFKVIDLDFILSAVKAKTRQKP